MTVAVDKAEDGFRKALEMLNDDEALLNDLLYVLYEAGAVTNEAMDLYDDWSEAE